MTNPPMPRYKHMRQQIMGKLSDSIKNNMLSEVENILDNLDDLMREHDFVSDELHIKLFHLFWYL